MEALKRISANTVEKRLLKTSGNPNFNINFYALNAKGEYAGVAMYAEEEDENGWAGETGTGRALRALRREGPAHPPGRRAPGGDAGGVSLTGSPATHGASAKEQLLVRGAAAFNIVLVAEPKPPSCV